MRGRRSSNVRELMRRRLRRKMPAAADTDFDATDVGWLQSLSRDGACSGESRAELRATANSRCAAPGCEGPQQGIQPRNTTRREQATHGTNSYRLLRHCSCWHFWSQWSPPVAAWAGGGPENVLLLVNSNSLNSKTIANHYIALRNIPPSNVVYIDWRGGLEDWPGQCFSPSRFCSRRSKPSPSADSRRRSTTWFTPATFPGGST